MNLFSKTSYMSLTLLTAIFVTGCDTAETTETTDTVDAADAKVVEVVETEPATAQTSTVAKLTSDSIDNLLYNPMIASGVLNDEQVTCLEGRDKTLTTQKAQEFYANNFTQEELSELDNFYASPTGQKMIDYGNEQIRIMSGAPIETPMQAPTEAELQEMQAFMETPLGQKYQQVNNTDGQGSLVEAINPIVVAELERCKIEGMG